MRVRAPSPPAGSRCGKRCRALVVAPTRDCRSARDHPSDIFHVFSFPSFGHPDASAGTRSREPNRHRLVSNCPVSRARARLSRSLPAPARPHSPSSSRRADPNPPRATRPPPLISNRPPAAPEGVFFFVLCRERAGDPTAGENAVVIEALQAYRHRISASSADSSADSDRPEPRARAAPNHPMRREDVEDGEDGEDTDEAFVVFDHPEVSAAARRAASHSRGASRYRERQPERMANLGRRASDSRGGGGGAQTLRRRSLMRRARRHGERHRRLP